MDNLMDIIAECYDQDIMAADCAKILEAAGYKGYNWERVADVYEAIYCQVEGK